MSTLSFATIGRGRRDWLSRAVAAAALALVGLGAILVAVLVGELLRPLAADDHHDFLAFYAAGRLVLDLNAAGLYLASAITTIERTIIPDPVGANGYMPFINPPFAAVVLAPLATLPPQLARPTWAVVNVGLLALAALWIGRPLTGPRRILAALLIGLSFPAYHSLAEGQWSALMLLGGVVALQAARAGSWRLAGLALATWWLKPQLVALPLLALVLDRRWPAVAWTILGGAALLVASLPFVGIDAYDRYARYLVEVGVSHLTGAGAAAASTWQGSLATLQGLNGLLVGILGQGAVAAVDLLWALLVAVLLAIWLVACRAQRPGFETPAGREMLAAGTGIVLLVDPNLYMQDCLLVFLLVPALWPATPADYWRAVVGVAAIAALTLLPVHLFTVTLLALVVGWCARRISTGRSLAVGRAPGPATG